MHIHLSKYDVISIRDQVLEAEDDEDAVERFCEEVIGCLEDADIQTIESRTGGDADEFMHEVYEQWDHGDPIELLDLLTDALSVIDVEFSFEDFDSSEEEFVLTPAWADDDLLDEEEEFEY